MMKSLSALLLVAFVAFALSPVASWGLPRFSLLTGTRCSACHFNPQGSGLRNELGWSTMNTVGAISPSSLGLDSLFSAETNSFLDGKLTFGLDTRLQYVKLGHDSDSPRMIIPMQLAPSVAFVPTEGLTLYGTYNAGPTRYPGQTNFDAAISYQPDITLPSIRAGYIQPSIGLRHDDHTVFVRRDAAGYNIPIIPPNYNEWGAEATYEGTKLVTLNGGIYLPKNISKKIELGVDSTKPLFSARAILWPQLLDEGINGMVGGSYFGNGAFTMINTFAGIGLADKATIYGEGMYMHTTAADRTIRNVSIMGTYQLAQWLNLEWRYEWGLSEQPSTGPFYAHAFVFGSEFFPFPYLELRPEYRYIENDQYSMGQYTLQMHVFY